MNGIGIFSAIFLILILAAFGAFGKIGMPQKKIEVAEALQGIVKNFFASKTSNLRVISSQDRKNFADFLSTPEFFVTFELLDISKLDSSSLNSSSFNIIQITNLQDFQRVLKEISSRKIDPGGFFLLVIDNCLIIDLSKLFVFAWRRYIYNINVLCQTNDTITIKTFMPFQAHSCGNTTPITVNYGDVKLMTNLYPEKVKNLRGCPIKLVTFFYPPITMRDTLEDGSFRYYGSEMDLVFGLADALNFTVNMTYFSQSGSMGLLLENGTATGLLKQTVDGEMDMLMGFYYLTLLRTQHMSFSQSHYSIPLIIMIPLGEPLSAFEKLFRPFQNIVWVFLLVTFGCGFIVIFIINCNDKKVQDFIYGKDIRNPYLNMINHFVGGSQPRLPKTNFARSLLMMFMLFCLVQRSIYQSSLYLFLQSEGRNPPISTIDEMIEKNFVFYVRETLEHNIRHMSFYSK